MTSNMITAAEIASQLAEMYPAGDPGLSSADKIVSAKLAELIALLTDEQERFEAAMELRYEEMWDARHDAISANWGHD